MKARVGQALGWMRVCSSQAAGVSAGGLVVQVGEEEGLPSDDGESWLGSRVD